ncbi:MAG: substrate-binding domain-containing protein [Phycisphaerae bacterium]|nr:substrate-binding domain-containing protein [Phycisphaerae bacterium]
MSMEPTSLFELSPAARCLVRELRRQVLADQIKMNSLLPSVRTIAAQAGVSAFPVQQALKYIERQGWAKRRNSKSRLRIVPAARQRAKDDLQYEPPLIINLVSPLHKALSYEYRVTAIAQRMVAYFGRCSARHVYIDISKGPQALYPVFEENEPIPNEVGYVLVSMPQSYHAVFHSRDLPCVVSGYVHPDNNLPSICEDMELIGYTVGSVLCPGGRAVMLHYGELVGGEVKLIDGVRRAANELGVPSPRQQDFYISVPEDFAECETRITQLLSRGHAPAGILAMRPEIAMLTLKVAARMRIRVPDNLQLVGYGTPHQTYELSYPAITSVGPGSDDELARICSELLAQSLGRRPDVAPRLILESKFIERQTTRPRGREMTN